MALLSCRYRSLLIAIIMTVRTLKFNNTYVHIHIHNVPY
jgi:hypothetical protein